MIKITLISLLTLLIWTVPFAKIIVYQVQIKYSSSSIIRFQPVKSYLKAEKMVMELQEDEEYQTPDAQWSILAFNFPLFQWLFT